MFTNNYIKYRDMMFVGSSSYNGFVASHGTTFRANAQYGYASDIGKYMHKGRCEPMRTESFNGFGVYAGTYFGSGSTQPTIADYKLEAPITSGLSIASQTGFIWHVDEKGGRHAMATFAVRNVSSNDINIWEVGSFVDLGATSSSLVYQTLMERQVLSEPITIKPGEAKIITYEIIFHQTLNIE